MTLGFRRVLFSILLINCSAIAHASPQCDIDVRVVNGGAWSREYQPSILDAFSNHNEGHPFILFASAIQEHVVSEIQRKFCVAQDETAKFDVRLLLYKLDLATSSEEIERLAVMMSGLTSPYANLAIDDERRTAIVSILWSERQMWRDHLALNGATFLDEGPLLPFSEEVFWNSISRYTWFVLGDRFEELNQKELAEMREELPPDLFQYLHQNPYGKKYFRAAASGMWDHVMLSSQAGYAEATKRTISLLMDSLRSQDQEELSVLTDPEVRALYEGGATEFSSIQNLYMNGLR